MPFARDSWICPTNAISRRPPFRHFILPQIPFGGVVIYDRNTFSVQLRDSTNYWNKLCCQQLLNSRRLTSLLYLYQWFLALSVISGPYQLFTGVISAFSLISKNFTHRKYIKIFIFDQILPSYTVYTYQWMSILIIRLWHLLTIPFYTSIQLLHTISAILDHFRGKLRLTYFQSHPKVCISNLNTGFSANKEAFYKSIICVREELSIRPYIQKIIFVRW